MTNIYIYIAQNLQKQQSLDPKWTPLIRFFRQFIHFGGHGLPPHNMTIRIEMEGDHIEQLIEPDHRFLQKPPPSPSPYIRYLLHGQHLNIFMICKYYKYYPWTYILGG